ncbi:hypothetical protein HDU67_009450 [Dinochytrium kinnereticum]|nr:hypothetical protein HDU67_009450 [Dinochytrium kinnereticum]
MEESRQDQSLSPEDINNAFTALHRQIVALQERLDASRSHANDRDLPDFKITSRKPVAFDGDLRKKQAHEAQAVIDEYLHQAAEDARLYGFRGDDEDPQYRNHKSYVDWISTGLTGLARAQWRRIDEQVRHAMTWREYCKWVRENFTLQQALDKIKQKGAATLYSQHFNELVAAIASSGIEYPEVNLCFKYRRGLKPILHSNEDLFQIQEDLQRLQRTTERLDYILAKGHSI